MDREHIKVKTPGKLILSGEHAVVHGHPALALAVNRYTETTVRWTTPLHFSFNLMGIDFRRRLTLRTLRNVKTKLQHQFQRYNQGHVSIRDVLEKPFELSLFTFMNVIDRLKSKLPTGIDVVTDSNIPMGCGMGSSAASVVSLTYALSQFLDMDLSLDDYISLGVESENLQHGFSSGLDVHTVYHGGCLRYKNGLFEKKHIHDFPMQLVQTGEPQSTTGECVTHTRSLFENSTLGDDFAAVTDALDQALQANHLTDIKMCIQQNHQLLRKIDVVPDAVNEFITAVESQNGAAKTCGAGSIQGSRAGMVVVISEEDITALANQYGYHTLPIKIDDRGTCVI